MAQLSMVLVIPRQCREESFCLLLDSCPSDFFLGPEVNPWRVIRCWDINAADLVAGDCCII